MSYAKIEVHLLAYAVDGLHRAIREEVEISDKWQPNDHLLIMCNDYQELHRAIRDASDQSEDQP